MGKFFSDKTEEGIRLVWLQYDRDRIIEGQQLLEQAASEDSEAYCFLGRTYMGGSVWEAAGLPEDTDRGFALMEKGAVLGSACCVLNLLQYDRVTQEIYDKMPFASLNEAYEAVLTRAEAGEPLCQLLIGMHYYRWGYFRANGIDPREKYESEQEAEADMQALALPWYEKALAGGATIALRNLLGIYDGKCELPADEEKMWKALKFASERGDHFWQHMLADMLYERENFEEALAWYTKAAEGGEASAWYDIGFQYENGMGTAADNAKSIDAYERGAKAGMAASILRLAKHKLWGRITRKDEAQAYYWFCKAAEMGDRIAKMFKGHCLLYGLGVKKDANEATNLLIDALNYNYPDEGSSQAMAEGSQFNWQEDMLQMFWDLGQAYEFGWSMPQRDHLAGYYYSMVAEGGWPEGIEKMTHYKEGMFGRWKRIK